MTGSEKRRVPSLLHLAWAIPSAMVVSIPLWLVAQYGLCYSETCGGEFGMPGASGLASSLILLLAACGVWYLVLRFAPWTARRRLRQGVAIGAAAGVALVTLALGLLWQIT